MVHLILNQVGIVFQMNPVIYLFFLRLSIRFFKSFRENAGLIKAQIILNLPP